MVNGIWIIQKTVDLYTTTDKFTDAIRKKCLKFYGYIYRNNNGFIKKQLI